MDLETCAGRLRNSPWASRGPEFRSLSPQRSLLQPKSSSQHGLGSRFDPKGRLKSSKDTRTCPKTQCSQMKQKAKCSIVFGYKQSYEKMREGRPAFHVFCAPRNSGGVPEAEGGETPIKKLAIVAPCILLASTTASAGRVPGPLASRHSNKK